MHHIIFDLETTCWDGMPLADQREIIEIGAVKLNAYGEKIDTFSSFVRPILAPRLSVYCKSLTGITQDEISEAEELPDVLYHFKQWCDEYEILAAWGKYDRLILIDDFALHELDEDTLDLSRYLDVKKSFRHLKNWHGKLSLKRAIEHELSEYEGRPHRALPDAENLTRLYLKYFGEWKS